MSDKIVYVAYELPGGIDGLSEEKGGRIMHASYSPITRETYGSFYWCKVVPEVVNTKERIKNALKKLDPIDKLVLGLNPCK